MRDSLDAACAYLRRGWAVIPLPARAKVPVLPGWPDLRLVEADLPQHFSKGANVGVLLGTPSHGLIDLDLDVPEAIALADEFLPSTNCIFGRSHRPRTHRLYTCAAEIATRKFEIPVQALPAYAVPPSEFAAEATQAPRALMLLEVRSTGTQTIVPPSVHPSEDAVVFDEDGTPAQVEGEAVLRVASRLAAATLLARVWPEVPGTRHAIALALAGGLQRAGWTVPVVEHFLAAVARAAGDEELADRLASVATTAEKIAQRQHVTGWPTLVELLGKPVVSRVTEWLGMRAHDIAPAGDSHRPGGVGAGLVDLALADTEALFHTQDGVPYAAMRVREHIETWPVHSAGFRRWLARTYYQARQVPPPTQALTEALNVLEGKALFDGDERAVFTRIGEVDGTVFLDLADQEWQVIAVDARGWRLVGAPPIHFRRARGMQALPAPVPEGDLSALRAFVNVGSDEDFRLLVAWLVGAARYRGPFPVLVLHGHQGSAKSTSARFLRHLIDPNTAPLRAEPRDVRDVMIAATNSWVQTFDNLSRLPGWFSDALCRLSTGGGFSTRELFADSEEVLFDAQRPVILNGIEELATRPDLLDRAIILYLPEILDDKRRSERVLTARFEEARPALLGAVLSAVSTALRWESSVDLPSPPRMADFAVWVVAAEPALPWRPGGFLSAYTGNREDANSLALEASPVAQAISKLVLPWEGTATALLDALDLKVNEEARRRKTWPRSSQALSNALRRIVPNLKQAGILVEFDRVGRARTRTVTISAAKASAASANAEGPQKHGFGDGERVDVGADNDSETASAGPEAPTGPGETTDGGADADTRADAYGSEASSSAESHQTSVSGHADTADAVPEDKGSPSNLPLPDDPDEIVEEEFES